MIIFRPFAHPTGSRREKGATDFRQRRCQLNRFDADHDGAGPAITGDDQFSIMFQPLL